MVIWKMTFKDANGSLSENTEMKQSTKNDMKFILSWVCGLGESEKCFRVGHIHYTHKEDGRLSLMPYVSRASVKTLNL